MNSPARQLSRIIIAAAVLAVIGIFLAGCARATGEASLGSKVQKSPTASEEGNGTLAGAVEKDCGPGTRCPKRDNNGQRKNVRPLLGENLSDTKKLTQPSRIDVRDGDTTLQKGELALSVPRLGLKDVPVPVGSTQAELDSEGILRLASSGVPWREGSNTVIVGHRLGYPKTRITYVFYELDEMRPGDEIVAEDSAGREYVYEVYDYMTVRPEDRWVMYPVEAMTTISLVTCTPIPTFENRLVVRGALVRVDD